LCSSCHHVATDSGSFEIVEAAGRPMSDCRNVTIVVLKADILGGKHYITEHSPWEAKGSMDG